MSEGSAVRAVQGYLASLEAGGVASSAVRRQRSWALGELLLFCAVRGVGDPSCEVPIDEDARAAASARVPRVRLADLFAPDLVDDWLWRADPVLRGVSTSSPATRRARVTSLRALASYVGSEPPAHRDPKPVLRDPLTEPEIEAALRALSAPLPGRGSDDHVRLAAVLAVMSVWPARAVDLSGMLVAQVVRRGSDVVLDVHDHLLAAGQPVLVGVGAERLLAWLDRRAAIDAALQGGAVRQLWTSIRSNSRPGGPNGTLPLPAGMPLRPRGLQRAYARSVVVANVAHAGNPGFPLPRSLDLLRRSLTLPV